MTDSIDNTYSDEDLDSLENMFGEPGWKLIFNDAKAEIYELQALALEVKSWDEVNFLRGKAVQLASLRALPDIVANYRKELKSDTV